MVRGRERNERGRGSEQGMGRMGKGKGNRKGEKGGEGGCIL